MGTETLASIRNTVRLRGDYPLSPKFTDAYVNKEIQAGWGELHELLADTHEGYLDKSDNTVRTVAQQPYVALPSDCWRVQAVDLILGGCPIELRRVGIGDRNRYGTNFDQPVVYRLSARGIELLPPPNAVYALTVYYTPKVTPLAETTPVEFYNNWDEFVIESAILRLHKRSERSIAEQMAALYTPETGLRARIAAAAGERNEQEPKYLQLREGYTLDEWGF